MKEPLISIIIVTWNNAADIEACLLSVQTQAYSNYNIIVVDNASTDSTVSIIQQKFPNIDILRQSKNHYFTGGNNIGIRYAIKQYQPKFVLVLNPDTFVPSDLLQKLYVAAANDENIGAVGPKILLGAGENKGMINSAGLIYDGFMQAYDRGLLEKDNGQYDQRELLFGVSGTCVLLRVKMLEEIGLFWERLQMYLDEVELFIRAHKNGWQILYTPAATIEHKYMVSTNQNKKLNTDKIKMRNWLLIALRHYNIKSKLAMLKHYLKYKLSGKS